MAFAEEFVRANTARHLDLIREFKPDVVVDSFGVFASLAAWIARVPLATVLPGTFLSGERWLSLVGGRTAGHLPRITPLIDTVASEYVVWFHLHRQGLGIPEF